MPRRAMSALGRGCCGWLPEKPLPWRELWRRWSVADWSPFPPIPCMGLAHMASCQRRCKHLYTIKERPSHMPIPLLLPDTESVETLCMDIPPSAWRIAERFWPGGLSLVLRRAPVVPDVVTAGGPTVAVRVPDQPMVRELCRRLGAPLAATSANRHGQAASVIADQVLRCARRLCLSCPRWRPVPGGHGFHRPGYDGLSARRPASRPGQRGGVVRVGAAVGLIDARVWSCYNQSPAAMITIGGRA